MNPRSDAARLAVDIFPHSDLLRPPSHAYNPFFVLRLESVLSICLERMTRLTPWIWIFAACRSTISV